MDMLQLNHHADRGGGQAVVCGRSCPVLPIQVSALSKLDRIVSDPIIWHDVNFGDCSVSITSSKEESFWSLLQTQLEAFMNDLVACDRELSGSDWSLPLVRQTIEDILGTLVYPEYESLVREILNVDYRIQHSKVPDLKILSCALKSHYTDIQVEWADICDHLNTLHSTRDVATIVQELQDLLDVLGRIKVVRQKLLQERNIELIIK
jgi:hypothetical protein